MMKKTKKGIWLNAVIFLLFIVALNVGRLLWISLFEHDETHRAEQGVLDLRDWDMNSSRTITLDGEWEFYPDQFIVSKGTEEQNSSQYIAVPGNWSRALNGDDPTPYGYGSYRLTLLVNPEPRQSFSIQVGSVRSASTLYVNDIQIARSGTVAEHKEQYVPYNIPYRGTFTSDDNGKIEIIIEAANFADLRGGGLIRSIKFGTEQAIANEYIISTSMQQLVGSIFLLHAFYAIMLYFADPRRPALLWFAIFVISFITLIMCGSDEKLMSVWFGFSYETGFRVVLFSITLMFVSLYQLIYPFLIARHRKYYYAIQALNVCVLLIALLAPFGLVMIVNNYYSLFMIAVVVFSIIVYLLNIKSGYRLHRMYFISLFAVANHLLWWFYLLLSGEKVMYYPFDLIIAMTTFSIIWTQSYIRTFKEKDLLTEKLQRNINQRDEFLANTSHELRNPLHSILNIAQVLLEREKDTLSPRSINDLNNVMIVSKRLSLLLNEMLEAMNMKVGGVRLNLSSISLHKLTVGVTDLLNYMRRSENVVIVNNIDVSFPKVWGDENRIIQIIYNLLHNALKFTSEGSVTIHAQQQGDYAVISITDTGIGIEQATLKHIFEPYEQGESAKAFMEGGFGLGLSISKKLVEMQGGKIYASSHENAGSTFSFTLPLATVEKEREAAAAVAPLLNDSAEVETAAAVAAGQFVDGDEDDLNSDYESVQLRWDDVSSAHSSASSSENSSSTPAANRFKLLLVDDDVINLNVLEAILEGEHYEITCANSATLALELIASMEWDLVISDVMMPEMSGYELTRLIRHKYALTELPILLLTARSQPEDVQHAFACGANDYVRKPMDANEIRSRVSALTGVKKIFRERLQLEAAWLQAQIQPHFLFNTINSVIALSEIDIVQMRELLTALGSYLQDKFRYNHIKDKTSLSEELSLVRTYVFIEQARFGQRLQVKWQVPEGIELELPPLTIQPLVENAIRHGVMALAEGGVVTIAVEESEKHYNISVSDNGVGMDQATQVALLQLRSSSSMGVGLINIERRLQYHYRQGLRIRSQPGAGTEVSFQIAKSTGSKQ